MVQRLPSLPGRAPAEATYAAPAEVSGDAPVIEPAATSRTGPPVLLWEVGVHASLTAEVLQIWRTFLPLRVSFRVLVPNLKKSNPKSGLASPSFFFTSSR